MNIEQINAQFSIPNALRIIEGAGDFPVVEISNQKAKAVISIYSAQVLSFQPLNEATDLMFVSDLAYYQAGKATKGGVPICWPWFGPAPHDGGASHGFVRNRMWVLSHTEALASGDTKVVFSLKSSEDTLELWPHPFELTFEVVVGESLSLTLTTKNIGNEPLSLTQALHTYFSVGDIHQVQVGGLDQLSYIDKVDGGTEKVQEGVVCFSSEVDRIYQNVQSNLVIDDPALGRKVKIHAKGSQTAVVWNPWAEISKNMADLADSDYLNFVCVETANAAQEVIQVPPNEEYNLQVSYSIEH